MGYPNPSGSGRLALRLRDATSCRRNCSGVKRILRISPNNVMPTSSRNGTTAVIKTIFQSQMVWYGGRL